MNATDEWIKALEAQEKDQRGRIPRIIGRIDFSQPSGYGGLSLVRSDKKFDNGYPWRGPVSLYAWSDGVVTWTEKRLPPGAPQPTD